jgi:hypothetical protein
MSTEVDTPVGLTYRSISPLGVAALLMGVASALAAVNPLLVVVPIVALILAIAGIRKIDANPDLLQGKPLCWIGAALAAFFLVYAPIHQWLRESVLEQRAQTVAEGFLDPLRRGQTKVAHEYSDLRFPDPLGKQPSDSNYDMNHDFEQFQKLPAVERLAKLDYRFDYQLEDYEPSRSSSEVQSFILRYRIIPRESGSTRSFPIWITVSRAVDQTSGRAKWRMVNVLDADPTIKVR